MKRKIKRNDKTDDFLSLYLSIIIFRQNHFVITVAVSYQMMAIILRMLVVVMMRKKKKKIIR